MLEFLAENYKIILLAVIVLAGLIYSIVSFSRKPTNAKLTSIKAWLLSAVTLAEKEFGAGTGAIKLSYVYSQFIDKFPALASLITFEAFSGLVDDVLDRFHSLLNSNADLQNYVSSPSQEAKKEAE